MPCTLETANVTSMEEVIAAMADWQHEGGPVQLHPGDFGWALRFGPQSLAAEVRIWRRQGLIVATGGVDTATGLIRMALAPSVEADELVAAQILSDVDDPDRMQLGQPIQSIEARFGTAVRGLLDARGWTPGESWTPLVRTLQEPVGDCGLRVATLDAEHADARTVRDRVAVHRSAFANSTLTPQQWQTMAGTTAYRNGRCLVGYDDIGAAVAATTVWSAGVGRPGLIEPLGVHRDHRGRGYGRAIAVAAAAALHELGASSMTVCTPSANVGAVAAYTSAGMTRLPESTDFRRPS